MLVLSPLIYTLWWLRGLKQVKLTELNMASRVDLRGFESHPQLLIPLTIEVSMKKQLEAIKDTMRKAHKLGSCFVEPDDRRLMIDPLKYQEHLDSRAGHLLGCFIAEKIAKKQCVMKKDHSYTHAPHQTEYRYDAVVIHPDDWNELTQKVIHLEAVLNITAKIEKQIKENNAV